MIAFISRYLCAYLHVSHNHLCVIVDTLELSAREALELARKQALEMKARISVLQQSLTQANQQPKQSPLSLSSDACFVCDVCCVRCCVSQYAVAVVYHGKTDYKAVRGKEQGKLYSRVCRVWFRVWSAG